MNTRQKKLLLFGSVLSYLFTWTLVEFGRETQRRHYQPSIYTDEQLAAMAEEDTSRLKEMHREGVRDFIEVIREEGLALVDTKGS